MRAYISHRHGAMAETLPVAAASDGGLRVPSDAQAVVVLVHGDSQQGQLVRNALEEARFATLEIHLDHADSAGAGEAVRRLTEQVLSHTSRPDLARLPIGIFGSELGGGAALAIAAARPDLVRALVLRDVRQHLIGSVPRDVRAATLLVVVDGQDDESIARNQETMTLVMGIAELEILPAPPADNDEAELMVHVALLARRWFGRFLV